MLQFLRNLRMSDMQSGKTRNYIFYAVGEIILVMVGILLALQVNNWNEWRKDRRLEQEYLENILVEMNSNLAHVEEQIVWSDFQVTNVDLILAALNSPEKVNRDSLLIAIEHVGWAYPVNYTNHAWNELVNNGNTRLIQDEDLRKSLASFHTTMINVIELNEEWLSYNLGFRRLVGDVIPPRMREMIALQLLPTHFIGDLDKRIRVSDAIGQLLELDGLNGFLADIKMGRRTNRLIFSQLRIQIDEIVESCDGQIMKD